MSDEQKKKETYEKIRAIDNVIYDLKLTFLELEQLQLWLSNIETNEEIEERILERIVIAIQEARKTGDSV